MGDGYLISSFNGLSFYWAFNAVLFEAFWALWVLRRPDARIGYFSIFLTGTDITWGFDLGDSFYIEEWFYELMEVFCEILLIWCLIISISFFVYWIFKSVKLFDLLAVVFTTSKVFDEVTTSIFLRIYGAACVWLTAWDSWALTNYFKTWIESIFWG